MSENYIFDFKYRDYVNELKQHLNLSESAWIVINEDIKNFYMNDDDQTRSGFLNRIFKNFYQYADASVSYKLNSKKEELEKLYSSKEFNSVDKETKQLFIDKLLSNYKQKLIKKNNSYEKGSCEKIRINKENLDIIRESVEGNYYIKNGKSSLGTYLKAIFEEYSNKPSYIREQIFFGDIIKEINLAIASEKKLKLVQTKRLKVNESRSIQNKFYISPYKIIQDSTKSFNYLIGYCEEIISSETTDENGNIIKSTSVGPKVPACFRISKIFKIGTQSSMGAHISKEKAKELDNMIVERGPQFIASEPIDIKIKFTKKGIENFKRQIYMRPNIYTVDENDKTLYTFHCTEIQAMNYFFKLGLDACIVEPQYLHDKFKHRYDQAVKAYSGMSKEDIINSYNKE